jgi:hypothetical protein
MVDTHRPELVSAKQQIARPALEWHWRAPVGIPERPVIQRMLDHLGLDPQPPTKGRACEPGPRFAAWVESAV